MKNRLAIIYAIYLSISVVIYGAGMDNLFRDEDFAHLHFSHERTSLVDAVKPSSLYASDRPGALSLFYLEYRLFGFNNTLYLLFNYLVHVMISLVAWRVLLDLGVRRTAAVLGASLFVLGYGHYGKQIMKANNVGPLVAVLITMLTVWLAVRWVRGSAEDAGAGSRRSRILYPIAVLVLLLVGVTIHELTLFTPLLVIVIIFAYPGRAYSRIVKIAPLLSPWLMWLVFLSRSNTVDDVLTDGVPRAASHLLLYFGFLLVPIQESVIAGNSTFLASIAGAATPIRLSAGLLLVTALVLAFVRAGSETRRPIRIMVMWLAIAIFPFCFVELQKGYLELRYLYYASIPYCGLVGCALSHLLHANRLRVKVPAATILLLVSLATATLATKLERKYDAHSRSAANVERLQQLRATIGD